MVILGGRAFLMSKVPLYKGKRLYKIPSDTPLYSDSTLHLSSDARPRH